MSEPRVDVTVTEATSPRETWDEREARRNALEERRLALAEREIASRERALEAADAEVEQKQRELQEWRAHKDRVERENARHGEMLERIAKALESANGGR